MTFNVLKRHVARLIKVERVAFKQQEEDATAGIVTKMSYQEIMSELTRFLG